MRGRSGEPRPVDGDEAVVKLHHPRSREAFVANPVDHRPIDGILARGEPCGGQCEKRDKDSAAIQHAELSRKTPVAVQENRRSDFNQRLDELERALGRR